MKIGEYIANYRQEHDLSQRDFAKISGVSNSLISMLEKDENPKTKKPIVLSIITYRKIAEATGTTVDKLFNILGPDAPVNINSPQAMSFVNISRSIHPEVAGIVGSAIREGETQRQTREREYQKELEMIKIFRSLTPQGHDFLLEQAKIAKKLFSERR